MSNALVVPVMSNFKGFVELIQSVDLPITPYIWDNWNKNYGVTIPWNRMIENAILDGHSHIFVANDDTTFAGGTMQKMIDALDNDGLDLVSPINTRDFQVTEERKYSLDKLDFASFAITPKTIEKFGYFDEELFAYFNDNDYARTILVNGGKCAGITDAGFYHVGSVTQFKGKEKPWEERVISHEDFRVAQSYFVAKWGGLPGQETYLTPWNRVQ